MTTSSSTRRTYSIKASSLTPMMMMMGIMSLLSMTAMVASAFVVRPQQAQLARTASTRLFLEDWVADLIDGELFRQGHKDEFDKEWMEKNRGKMFYHMQSIGGEALMAAAEIDNQEDFRMHAKDQKLAVLDPQKYCADRCITTGNCDIYEDL
jgi:hypothetical protein